MERSILLDSHRAEGAAISNGEPPLALAFVDPPAEYRAAREAAAIVDETDRGELTITGADAPAFLHRMLANEVRALAPGQGNRSLLLSNKGKVLFDFDLAREADSIRASTPRGRATALARALDTYLFNDDVRIAETTAAHAPIGVVGPRAGDLVARVIGVRPPEADHATLAGAFEGRPARVTTLPIAGSTGARLDVGPERALALWRALRANGASPLGRVAYDSLRVEAGWAEPGIDVDENVYPQEARLERAFRLDKGCYVGQEVVAKVDTYGGLNKRLVALRVAHDDPVPRGTRLFRFDGGEWRDLGVVTSWAYSFALDGGIALAYVKRRHQAAGTTFHLGDAEGSLGRATLVELPVRPDAVPISGDVE